jgi:hypothetical protein
MYYVILLTEKHRGVGLGWAMRSQLLNWPAVVICYSLVAIMIGH